MSKCHHEKRYRWYFDPVISDRLSDYRDEVYLQAEIDKSAYCSTSGVEWCSKCGAIRFPVGKGANFLFPYRSREISETGKKQASPSEKKPSRP
jgi:hypothetical protein